jgi:hypothetical protein
MHHFVAEMGQLQIGAAAVFLRRAESVYEENLSSYVKLVLRRPFAKIIVSVVPTWSSLKRPNISMNRTTLKA